MSIRPRWADAIMDGRKRVEFRRCRFSRPVSHVIVYATSPVRRVLGYFDVAEVTRAEPRVLWERFASMGEIERDAFDRYYEGAADGTAIHIGGVFALREPLDLREVLPAGVPPQSFCYASPSVVDELGARARIRDRGGEG